MRERRIDLERLGVSSPGVRVTTRPVACLAGEVRLECSQRGARQEGNALRVLASIDGEELGDDGVDEDRQLRRGAGGPTRFRDGTR